MTQPGDVRVSAPGLDDARVAAILHARQAALAPPPPDAAPGIDALAWLLGGERFALPLTALWGVAAPAPVTPVPGAPPALLGLFNRRGVVHNLFDPAALLGVVAGDGRGHVLLLRHLAPRIGLRVDAAEGVMPVPADALAGDGLGARLMLSTGPVTLLRADMLVGRLLPRSPTLLSQER